LIFKPQALEDLKYWRKNNTKVARRILTLLTDIQKEPCQGIGKPEALKHDLSGWWSRRINRQHRLVYQVQGNALVVLQCRFQY